MFNATSFVFLSSRNIPNTNSKIRTRDDINVTDALDITRKVNGVIDTKVCSNRIRQ